MRTLFIDNRDSFVYNLVDYVAAMEPEVEVLLNTSSLRRALEFRPQAVVLSPGPGSPHRAEDVGICPQVLRAFPDVPTLGVCLGHQVIASAYGGRVTHAPVGPVHGKASSIHHDGEGVFRGLPNPLVGGRYHSLSVERLPQGFKVTARSDDGLVMGLRHRSLPLEGVQFHPESVLTPMGRKMVENFIGQARVLARKAEDVEA